MGRAMSLALADAGADIVLIAWRQQDMDQAYAEIIDRGKRCLAMVLDISHSREVNDAMAEAIAQMGKVDILINNAGFAPAAKGKPIWEMDDEEWDYMLDVNLSGTFYCSRALGKHMAERGRGSIVNIASLAGMRALKHNFITYCASKAGVISVTQVLAVSWAEFGIRVNCIAPASFATKGRTQEDFKAMAQYMPVGRAGEPEEIGPLAVYLASDASSYVTGQVFCIDGGTAAAGIAPMGYIPQMIKD